MLNSNAGKCIVYGRHGEPAIHPFVIEPGSRRETECAPTEMPVAAVMNRAIVCARADVSVAAIVRLMIEHHIGCIPVIDERRRPLGVITKWDLVEQIDATMQNTGSDSPLPADLAPRVADEIMMPLALTLGENATVEQAAEMMTSEDTHHVLVVAKDSTLVGVVSSKDIASLLVTSARAKRDRLARGTSPPHFVVD